MLIVLRQFCNCAFKSGGCREAPPQYINWSSPKPEAFLLNLMSILAKKWYHHREFFLYKNLVLTPTKIPMCIFWWTLKVDFWEKLLSQWSHGNGFSPVCILWCVVRLSLREKLFSQWSHGNGFSPVCTLWCVIRLSLWKKIFSQWLHLNVFSPVCTLWCVVRLSLWKNSSQNDHMEMAFPQCVLSGGL